jgi:hypothetical protein
MGNEHKPHGKKPPDKPPPHDFTCPAPETSPPRLSVCLCDIPLGVGDPPTTGVYFPEKFMPGGTMDVIIYFHGFRDAGRCQSKEFAIDGYWQNEPFKLRELVNGSQKNLILITKGGDWYLEQVRTRLAKMDLSKAGIGSQDRDKGAASLRFGNVYLAAHSGGGVAMLFAAKTIKNEGKLQECWGFDSMYGIGKLGNVVDEWVAVAKGTTQSAPKVIIYYVDKEEAPTTKYNSEEFRAQAKKLGFLGDRVFVTNVTEHETLGLGKIGHCAIPKTLWNGATVQEGKRKTSQVPKVGPSP